MCGITGFFSFDNLFSEDDLIRMTDAISHRGPDSFGHYYNSPVGIGHRRLSILDLSERGNQPLWSANNRYVIVYNGEVYNYREIASNLKYDKYPNETFKLNSSSDTEAILEAFVAYGVNFVNQLNGMFAFAIYDTLEKELYVYRDRMGIKPLYYYWDGKNFAFASELKSLVSLNQIPKEINTDAISEFLHLGYIPAPNSIYKNIHKLESGSYLQISKSNFKKIKYWSIEQKYSEEVLTDEKKAIVMLSDLMMSSVQYQLRSDVPFGVFLSGGIDSSLVTAQAANLSGTKINTFSIGFEENKYSESKYARDVAKHLGTSHHEFIVSKRDALPLFEEQINTYDEPFGDSSFIPTMLVSKLAKQHVTVTLSGEGGDELFFGYGSYNWAKRLDTKLIHYNRALLSSVLNKFSNRYKRVARMLDYENKNLIYSHIHSQEQYYFSTNEIVNILNENVCDKIKFIDDISEINNLYLPNLKRTFDAKEKQSLFDLKYYLQDDLLVKVDRASMHYSLETRVPYLDHRIVEFALNLSPELKSKNGVSKYILKEILYQYVPKHFFDRPKQGFAIPLKEWLQNDLTYLIDEYLCEAAIKKVGILNYNEVNSLVNKFRLSDENLYQRIWLLICLQRWFINTY